MSTLEARLAEFAGRVDRVYTLCDAAADKRADAMLLRRAADRHACSWTAARFMRMADDLDAQADVMYAEAAR